MDECDLSTEEKEELKREICNICVISMDRILECINYKRPEIQLGWWNKDAEEKILNFITSVSIFLYIYSYFMNQILVYFMLKILLIISRPLSKGTISTQCYNKKKADQCQTLQFYFIFI